MIEANKVFTTKEHGEIVAHANTRSDGTRIEFKYKYLGANFTTSIYMFPKEANEADLLKATDFLNSLTEEKAAQLLTNYKNGLKPQYNGDLNNV
ncbi:hypothetical protein MTZ49_01660 [Entomomonas sp. E2T0]|uniref:hypothetical protein n=1 Tax=Entomomonas sp. E2T0 TaxID=2930213 RepID=UPI0022283898|nr:hypothetical protein [Entomomonas sp. E2T0]UYZ84314.1 hypothetical protein MTZ49_01660 [Entomomonas sp. E2T0]